MAADEEQGPIHRPVSVPSARKAVELEVAEGILLLENAARLKLKNRIIVDTLTNGDAGHADLLDGWVGSLVDQLEAFAAQSAESAQRLAVERNLASTADGLGRYYHDYRHLDTDNLTRRIRIALEVSRLLRRMTDDPKVLAQLLADARSLADEELEDVVRRTLATASVRNPEDAELLAARIQQLATIDIPALAESAARRRPDALPPTRGRVRRLLALIGAAAARGRARS